jgi:tRNA pseudouridine13 synthase
MARIKTTPEDFVVDEIPAYEPSGEGDHLYVRLRKHGRTTSEVVSALSRALDVPERDIGVAGLKDKVGVTTQTVSLPRRPELEARVRDLALSDVTVLEARWHKNKLKTGHLKGNRFDIVVREVADVSAALAGFEAIAREGVPNAFGPQRFGIDGRNVERAKAWLSGKERPPRDPKARRFSFSAWQSHLFNRVLERRMAEGSWASVLEGDLLMKHGSGGMFVCTDVATDALRAQAGELSATGPMLGATMRWPEGQARALEQEVIDAALDELGVAGDAQFLARLSGLGEGTRRPLCQWVTEISAARLEGGEAGALRVQFVLPSGAYATTVLARAIPEMANESGASSANATHAAHETHSAPADQGTNPR